MPFLQTVLRTAFPAKNALKLTIISILLIALFGCVSGGKQPIMVQQYAIDYQSPGFNGLSRLDKVIMVDRFSIVHAYNSKAMVYRTTPFKYGDDAYNRWRANPADMVTDCLLRDMRNAGLFKAAFSYHDTADAGYILGGTIEEFIESEAQGESQAILSLHVSLLNATKKDSSRMVVFQKTYRVVKPIERREAESFVQAMSRAMELLSKQVITDAYQAIRQADQALK